MSMIYFKYSNDGWVTDKAESFDALINNKYPVVEKGHETTLSGTITNHVYSKRSVGKMDITIAEDELWNTAKFNFLYSMYEANDIQYSFDNQTFIDGVWQGDFPEPDYLNGNRNFPSLSFTIDKKEAD